MLMAMARLSDCNMSMADVRRIKVEGDPSLVGIWMKAEEEMEMDVDLGGISFRPEDLKIGEPFIDPADDSGSSHPKQVTIQKLYEFRRHDREITKIATKYGQGLNNIVTCAKDSQIIVWRVEETFDKSEVAMDAVCVLGIKGRRSKHNHSSVWLTDVFLSHRGWFALSSAMDSSMILWDLTKETAVWRVEAKEKIVSISVTEDNTEIATCSLGSSSFKLWSGDGKQVADFSEKGDGFVRHSDCIRRIRYRPGAPKQLFTCGGRVVKSWDLRCTKSLDLNRAVEKQQDMNFEMLDMAVSKDGKMLVVGGESKSCGIFNVGIPIASNSKYQGAVMTEFGDVHALSYSPDRILIAGASGGHVVIWNAARRYKVGEIPPPKVDLKCSAVAWFETGGVLLLLSGYADGKLNVFKIT